MPQYTKNQFMSFRWVQDAQINICFSVESQFSPVQPRPS